MAEIEDIERRVHAFVARELAVKPTAVSADARLYHDFGLSGDDAEAFLTRFGSEFRVDLSACLASLHFSPEPTLISFFSATREFVPVTVRDLVISAQAGQWIVAALASTPKRKTETETVKPPRETEGFWTDQFDA